MYESCPKRAQPKSACQLIESPDLLWQAANSRTFTLSGPHQRVNQSVRLSTKNRNFVVEIFKTTALGRLETVAAPFPGTERPKIYRGDSPPWRTDRRQHLLPPLSSGSRLRLGSALTSVSFLQVRLRESPMDSELIDRSLQIQHRITLLRDSL